MKVQQQADLDMEGTQLLIALYFELKKTNDLFILAHKLVDRFPREALPWYAIGCYYCLIGNRDHAKRYFEKSCAIDSSYGPGWLMFGHALAADNEHDPAMHC